MDKRGIAFPQTKGIDFHDWGTERRSVFSKGGSLILGSSASNLRLVFYEKGYEQKIKVWNRIRRKLNRYELRFRQEMAVSVVQALLRYRDGRTGNGSIKQQKYDFRKADRQARQHEKALSNLSSKMGGTDERYRQGVKLPYSHRRKSLQRCGSVGLESISCPQSLKLFAEVEDRAERLYR